MKEILLYSGIYSYTASSFIEAMEAAKDEDVLIRLNTPGGDVQDSFGIVAKFLAHPKKKKISVDGQASSAGAFLCCYAEDVECLDVSEFLFHRATYGAWLESSKEYFTDDMRASLVANNVKLRAAMEGKIKADEWEKVTGVSLDDLFSMESRIDVTITAAQAKKLGLVNKVINITPEKRAAIEATVIGLARAAHVLPRAVEAPAPEAQTPPTTPLKTTTIMTLAEFKAAHPALFAEALKEGIDQERDRVGSFMIFNDVAPEAVAKGIADGKSITATQMAEFTRKAMSAEGIKNMTADSADAIETPEVEAAAAVAAGANPDLVKLNAEMAALKKARLAKQN